MMEERQSAVGKGAFLRDVVAALERAGNPLCVLRGYARYPEHVGEDVDAICADPAAIPRILLDQKVAKVIQVLKHETTFYYLYRPGGDKPVFLTLDVAKNYGHRGRVFLKGEEFLNNCRDFKFFKVPAPELEFVSYLIRKVTQGSVDEAQAERLGSLFRMNPDGARQQLDRFFPQIDAALIAEAARDGEWQPVRDDIGRLRRAMLDAADRSQRMRSLRHWAGILRKRADRLLRPPGLMVAFLGTDGSGKSTIMAEVERDLGPAFWDRKQYHKRPLSSPFRWTKRYRIRPPRVKRPETAGPERVVASGFNPHALPSRGAAYSLAKLVFWWIDFTVLGYLIEIFPRLTRLSLLLFDRYYQDLLIDPRRYHYGGSMRLARLVGRFVPQPHLVFLLDAPPEVLRSRKQELPFEEVARQREAYKELVRRLPNGHVVDTSRPLDEVAAEVEGVMLDYMARRTARRLRLRPNAADARTP
jgi:thymidylate kinase